MLRRELLQAGVAIGATIGARAVAAQAATMPVVGLITPNASSVVPEDGPKLYGEHMRFLANGVGAKTMTQEGFDAVIDRIVPLAQEHARNGASAIVIYGTSMTFYRGSAFHQKLLDDVHSATGLPASSMSAGVVNGLKSVNARRVAVATAYNEEVTRRLGAFLGDHGYEVVALKGMGLEAIGAPRGVSPATVQKFSTDVFNSAPRADALVVSCGGLPTLDIIAPLESACGVPTVSSSPHCIWESMRLAGLHVKVPGFGRLIAEG